MLKSTCLLAAAVPSHLAASCVNTYSVAACGSSRLLASKGTCGGAFAGNADFHQDLPPSRSRLPSAPFPTVACLFVQTDSELAIFLYTSLSAPGFSISAGHAGDVIPSP